MIGRFFIPFSVNTSRNGRFPRIRNYIRCVFMAATNLGILVGMIAAILSVTLAVLRANGVTPTSCLLTYLFR